MTNDNFQWLKWISEIQAIAQSGLTYTTNEYDKERYVRLREIAAELSVLTQFDGKFLTINDGYPLTKKHNIHAVFRFTT